MKKSSKTGGKTKRVKTKRGAKLPKGLRPWVVMPPREDTLWVSVKERLPKVFESVFYRVDDDWGMFGSGYLGSDGCWFDRKLSGPIDVTYWMPIPPLPKEGK